MKRILASAVVLSLTLALTPVWGADYVIDTQNDHAFIVFRIKHLGYSWLWGRFNHLKGTFKYDETNPASSRTDVTVETDSIDTDNALRDKHLRGEEFLDVEKFPTARFVSTSYVEGTDGKATLQGNLTLHGVTRPITIAVESIGHGPDPWGGYRRGFAGSVTLTLQDFGIPPTLGPASAQVELFLSVEGIRTESLAVLDSGR